MIRNRLFPVPFALVFLGSAALALAAQAPAQPGAGRQVTARQAAPAERAQPAPVRTVTEPPDAGNTRQELQELLGRYSPSLGAVLKLDPALLTSADYLAPYPGLAEFLARHPEIARDPAYFFEYIDGSGRAPQPYDPRHEAVAMWRSTMEGVAVFTVMLIVVFTVLWLVKTLVDSRRWWRLSKVQAEVHNKILDRFASNEDLLAYVQTPAGRRFLESAPIALDPAGPSVAAPVRRILWALEAGVVIFAGGIGMQFVSGRVPPEVAPMLVAIGVLGVALGIGFVVAAAVSFFLSKRLGLLPAPPSTGAAS